MALLLRSGTAWLPWELPWQLWSERWKWNVSPSPPPGQPAHCSSYAAGIAVMFKLLGRPKQGVAEHAFDCLLKVH